MLRLHGFPASNYYNLAKITLMEKGLDFEEVHEFPFSSQTVTERSPRAKYPYLETDKGFISESLLIAEYLEDLGGGAALLPDDPYDKAKVREIAKMNELYLEWVVRRVITGMFGAPVAEELKQQTKADLEVGVAAIGRVVQLSPYVAGSEFTLADISSAVHWPMVRNVSKAVLGTDPFADMEGVDEYLAMIVQRPSVAQALADQKEDMPRFQAHLQKLFG